MSFFLKTCNLNRVASLEIGPACPSMSIHQVHTPFQLPLDFNLQSIK